MDKYRITAICSFGIESVLAGELRALGYHALEVENGAVSFDGTALDVARCNLRLRTADRVLIRMARFRATDFGQLFDQTKAVPWEELIQVNGCMHVIGKSVDSKLHSVPDCQSIVKKAVIEAMKRRYKNTCFEETGPLYRIQVAMFKDTATLTVDTSGSGLHKRGYRTDAGEAPIKETMAAALVMLSRWHEGRVLADPMCGSGTIAIEAGLIGRNAAPGLGRTFACEEWNVTPREDWARAREEARDLVRSPELRILASDYDNRVLQMAIENARNAGLGDAISFQRFPLAEFRSKRRYGCLVTNPPYGERIDSEVESVYRDLGQVARGLEDWSFFVLTSHPDFEKHFGRKADKNRKLYNATIRCYFYQYFGPLPPRGAAAEQGGGE